MGGRWRHNIYDDEEEPEEPLIKDKTSDQINLDRNKQSSQKNSEASASKPPVEQTVKNSIKGKEKIVINEPIISDIKAGEDLGDSRSNTTDDHLGINMSNSQNEGNAMMDLDSNNNALLEESKAIINDEGKGLT